MDADLAATVTRLYTVFGGYALAPGFERRGTRPAPDAQAELARTPLRELSAAQLDSYLFHAPARWGDGTDFKHLLPRALDLFATGAHRDPFLLRKTLGHALDPDWPPAEHDAVRRYHLALWRQALASPEPLFPVADVLLGCSQHGRQLPAYLAAWAGDGSQHAARRLSRFVTGEAGRVPEGADERYQSELADWFSGGEPAAILTAALADETDPAAAAHLEHALEVLGLDWRPIVAR